MDPHPRPCGGSTAWGLFLGCGCSEPCWLCVRDVWEAAFSPQRNMGRLPPWVTRGHPQHWLQAQPRGGQKGWRLAGAADFRRPQSKAVRGWGWVGDITRCSGHLQHQRAGEERATPLLWGGGDHEKATRNQGGDGGVAGGVWSDCCPIPHIPLVQGPGGWDHLSPLYKDTQK